MFVAAPWLPKFFFFVIPAKAGIHFFFFKKIIFAFFVVCCFFFFLFSLSFPRKRESIFFCFLFFALPFKKNPCNPLQKIRVIRGLLLAGVGVLR